MATKIPKDFQPNDRSYELAARAGAVRAFVDDQYEHFLNYWINRGDKGDKLARKEDWNSCWVNWMKRAFNGKCGTEWEKSRHYRTVSQGSTGNPFEAVLAKLQPGETPPIGNLPDAVQTPTQRPAIAYRPEPTGVSMTAEAAFAELRKQGVLK
jgi:hypothetical protein